MEFQKPLAELKNLTSKTFSKSEKPEESQEEPKKFGMLQGVFTPMVFGRLFRETWWAASGSERSSEGFVQTSA